MSLVHLLDHDPFVHIRMVHYTFRALRGCDQWADVRIAAVKRHVQKRKHNGTGFRLILEDLP